MSEYRIKIVQHNGNTLYFPQRRSLWVFWTVLLVECGRTYNLYYSSSREKAVAVIENDRKQREKYPKKVMYEYID